MPAGQMIRQRRSSEDAEAALASAQQTLREVQGRRPEVAEQAATLRQLREANHFAELFTRAMGGQP